MKLAAKVSAWVCCILVLGLILYGCAGAVLVRYEERNTPRNPDTGIAIGAEELTLGPEDASGAVLFVHGFIGGSSNFADVPQAIAAEGWHVRAMRLPGHGTSPMDFAKTPPEELIAAVREETQALKEKYGRVVLVGHSMGATLCTLIAAEMPVDGLVLGAPYFAVTHRWYYGFKPETWVKAGNWITPYLYKGTLFLQVKKKEAKPFIYSYTWVPMKGTMTLMNLGERVQAEGVLERIQCPMLILHAPEDVAASYTAAQQALTRFGSSDKRLVELPNSSHHIFWDYEADLVKEELVAFVNGCLSKASS